MTVRMLLAAGAAGLICGFAAPADIGFDVWGTGDSALAYNRMTGDCEGVTHAFGRNAAWGLWRIPLQGVTVAAGATENGAELIFRCDAGACIQAGKLEDTPERIADHRVRYDREDDATAMKGRIETLQVACRER